LYSAVPSFVRRVIPRLEGVTFYNAAEEWVMKDSNPRQMD
jgi:hypothetical protein